MSKDNQQIIIDGLMARIRELEKDLAIQQEVTNIHAKFIDDLIDGQKTSVYEFLQYIESTLSLDNGFTSVEIPLCDDREKLEPLFYQYFKDMPDNELEEKYYIDKFKKYFPERK